MCLKQKQMQNFSDFSTFFFCWICFLKHLDLPVHMISNWKVGGFWGVANRSCNPPLCDFTLKWFNFFSIGRISGLEKYVMFQHQVCLFSRNCFDFVCFPRFWPKNNNFWLFFNLNGLHWWETDKVKKFDKNGKFWVVKIFFHSPCAIKAKKLTAMGLFKVESVLDKNSKSKFQRKFGKFNSFCNFQTFTYHRLNFEQTHSCQFLAF